MRVLLPEPLGPINATTSLLCTSKSTSLRTCLSPKYLLTLMALMMISEGMGFMERSPLLVAGCKASSGRACSESMGYSFTYCNVKSVIQNSPGKMQPEMLFNSIMMSKQPVKGLCAITSTYFFSKCYTVLKPNKKQGLITDAIS